MICACRTLTLPTGSLAVWQDGETHSADSCTGVTEWTYEGIIARAREDVAFQSGLLAAAYVCRAQSQGSPTSPPCPSGMAAVYIENLANGEMP